MYEWSSCSFAKMIPPWEKDSLITNIFIELCLLWYLAECTFFLFTLYYLQVGRYYLPGRTWKNWINGTTFHFYGKKCYLQESKSYSLHFQIYSWCGLWLVPNSTNYQILFFYTSAWSLITDYTLTLLHSAKTCGPARLFCILVPYFYLGTVHRA